MISIINQISFYISTGTPHFKKLSLEKPVAHYKLLVFLQKHRYECKNPIKLLRPIDFRASANDCIQSYHNTTI